MFGDHRQLYPWELANEGRDTDTIASGAESDADTSDPWGFASSPRLSATSTRDSSLDDKSRPLSPDGDVHTAASSSPSPRHSAFFDLGYIPRGSRPTTASESGSDGAHSGSRRSSTTPGGLYFAPAAADLPPSSRVWAPFTKQLSPIVARAQRNLVATAALYGLVIMAITAAICLSVPNRK